MYFFAWQRLFFSVRDPGVNFTRLLMNYYKRRGEADTDEKERKNDTRGALVSDGGIGGTCSRFFMLAQLYHAEASKSVHDALSWMPRW